MSFHRASLGFGPNLNALSQVRYGYDGLSRRVSMTNWLTPTQTLSYTPEGLRLKELNYPNAVKASYSFDGSSRLTGLSHLNNSTSTSLFSAAYTLDGGGNRTVISETLNGVGRDLRYRYDELSRLTRESQQVGTASGITSTYLYDPVGNRTSMQSILPPNTKGSTLPLVMTTTYNYDSADRLITRTLAGSPTPFAGNVLGYSYDANSSLISETNTASGGEVKGYNYDSRNRLTGWSKQAKGTKLVWVFVHQDS